MDSEHEAFDLSIQESIIVDNGGSNQDIDDLEDDDDGVGLSANGGSNQDIDVLEDDDDGVGLSVNCGSNQDSSDDDEQVQLRYEVVVCEDGSKGWVPVVDDTYKPRLNGRFESYADAEVMYRRYADMSGFDVRLNAKKTNRYGHIQTRWFVCSKEGTPRKKEFDSLNVGPWVRRGRNSNVKRSGCKACVKIHLSKDKTHYEVYDFVEVHNHVLFNSNDRRFSKNGRRMQYTDFRSVLRSSTFKVGATKAHRMQTVLNGGFANMGCMADDYKNFRKDVGVYVGNKDAQMLINKMTNRKDIMPDYFFEYKCNEKVLHAIFWADEVAQINYREFGDVISFDATYRSNEHAMAFVPFLAVDNHKRSVVVGSSLIAGEKTVNFKWVLQAFLKCYQKQPKVVITDQCPAMKQAVSSVLTESIHRLCMWHIMDKIPKKVSVALKQNPEFNRVIKKLVWNVHISPEVFELEWEKMIHDFDLVGDPWFCDIYGIRHSWIPAYFKDTPMSGLMKTTSRSESANAFFNLYTEYESDLVEFLIKYDSAIEKQRVKQARNENVTRTTRPQFVTPLGIEVHAAKLYTRTIFYEFQKELKKAMWFCGIEQVQDVGESKLYFISHQNKSLGSKVIYKVLQSVDNESVECDCNFFVRNGFLCRHSLKVLINCQVEGIPDKYVVRRWTRELVPVQIESAAVRYREIDSEKEKYLRNAYSSLDDIASRVRNDKKELKMLDEYLCKYKKELATRLPDEDPSQQKIDAIKDHFGVPVPDDVDVYAPTGLKNKGSGTGKRLQSSSEKLKVRSKKPKRKCKRCGLSNGHDSRNCPLVRG